MELAFEKKVPTNQEQWNLLKNHMKIVPDEQFGALFKCQICQRCFTREHTLKMHLESHFNIKRHQCHVCLKRFMLKQYLRDHMFIHTDEKPYACLEPGCGRKFRHKGKLSAHKATHAPKAKAPRKSITLKNQMDFSTKIFKIDIRFEPDLIDKEVELFELPLCFKTKMLDIPQKLAL
mmetsp:Transcript_17434/g.19681  ORF Transcript_17434/g.19681 Transcript_17434/m.19681 type:complete len:177 (+) Transcript_17434:923-1453(+)